MKAEQRQTMETDNSKVQSDKSEKSIIHYSTSDEDIQCVNVEQCPQ